MSQQRSKISVVVATYNYGQYIEQALESICAQTFADFDVLIVDDGSTDDTSQRVRPFLADSRFRYELIEHAGASAAKNHGVRNTTGELVALLDSDDIWMPTKLERQLELFARSPDLGLAYTRRITICPDGEERDVARNPFYRGRVLAEMFRKNFVCYSSVVVRRAVLDDVGIFNEELPLALDFDLWLRVAAKYDFDYVDEPLVKYRTGHANLSQRGEERLNIAMGIMRRFLATHPDPNVLPRSVIHRSFAGIYCSLGYERRDRTKLGAMAAYCTALTYHPGFVPAWRGVVVSSLPIGIRGKLRSLRDYCRGLAR